MRDQLTPGASEHTGISLNLSVSTLVLQDLIFESEILVPRCRWRQPRHGTEQITAGGFLLDDTPEMQSCRVGQDKTLDAAREPHVRR